MQNVNITLVKIVENVNTTKLGLAELQGKIQSELLKPSVLANLRSDRWGGVWPPRILEVSRNVPVELCGLLVLIWQGGAGRGDLQGVDKTGCSLGSQFSHGLFLERVGRVNAVSFPNFLSWSDLLDVSDETLALSS